MGTKTLLAIAAGACCLFVCAPGAVRAQDPDDDTVALSPVGTSSRVMLRGTIVDFTGKTLTMRSHADPRLKRYSSSEVISVETRRTEPHELGLRALARAQIDAAERQFESALKEEDRAWVRRELLGLLVRCALWRGERRTAATRFLLLAESDPDTRRYDLIPLVWEAEMNDSLTTEAARGWLVGALPAARLIGASLLLGIGAPGQAAAAELARLTGRPEEPIRELAAAQLWRVKLETARLTQTDVRHWEARVESMSQEIRGGPQYLLGKAYRAVNDQQRAAEAYLWLPLVYWSNRRLAARACVEAGEALASLDRADEAKTVFTEAAQRFGDTPSSARAVEELSSLSLRGR